MKEQRIEDYRKGYQAGFEAGKRNAISKQRITKHITNIGALILLERGCWVGIDDFPHDEWECDHCGYVTELRTNFCPDCGADMREQDE